jgi:hypothetical protein
MIIYFIKKPVCKPVLCLFLLFISYLGHSQIKDRVQIAIYGGVTLSKLYNAKSPFADFNYHTEFIIKTNVGVYLKYKLFPHVWVSSGISKGNWGTKVNYNALTPASSIYPYLKDYRWHINIDNKYLTIPLAIEYHFGKKINFFTKVGGYLGKLDYTRIDGFMSLIEFDDNMGRLAFIDYRIYGTNSDAGIHDYDYGVVVGFGATRALTQHLSILLESNLNIGLRQIDSRHNNDVRNDLPNSTSPRIEEDFYGLSSHAKNLVISINAGLVYKL